MLTKIKSWVKLTSKKSNDTTKSSLQKVVNKKPKIIPRSKHNVSRNNISKNALKVLYRLKNAGYQGYLVGGGIRDLLLGIQPKDFDVATDARPEDIRKLFRNCRLIGRRFRLAHIYFGNEIIEVATFRSTHESGHQTDRGMLLRDNVYGDIGDDVIRRDFTINAIYYNIHDYSLVDYVNGIGDIKKKQLRIIGDPEVRYREDPVRMLRAIRLASKLNLKLHKGAESLLPNMAPLLKDVSSSRLYDEYLKFCSLVDVQKGFEKLISCKIFPILFPKVEPFLQNSTAVKFISVSLQNANERISLNKPISPTFLLAVFLWYPYDIQIKNIAQTKRITLEIKQEIFLSIMATQRQTLMVPKRLSYLIRDIWFLQNKLIKLTVSEVVKCYKSVNFRLAYDFLILREKAGNKDISNVAKWWVNYVEGNDKTRRTMLKELGKSKRR